MVFTTEMLTPYFALFVGFGLSFLFYARYGFRTLGMKQVPLLAICDPDHRPRGRHRGRVVSGPSLPSSAASPYPLQSAA